MSSYHAAALTLLGWYLMMPPAPGTPPLAEWKHTNSFDSAAACETFLLKLINDMRKQHKFDSPTAYAECIASDDPRLKSK